MSDYFEQKRHICGRPLGICFNEVTNELYIVDAYMGLLKVGPEGGLATSIATHAQGTLCYSPMVWTSTNSMDPFISLTAIETIDCLHLNFISIILNGDKTGRLMKYEQESKQVRVVLNNLSFPNGVALSNGGSFLVFAETTKCRILRYWLNTSKAETLETFAQLPGFPDNIIRSPRGGFWVAMHSRRDKILAWILSFPRLGNALVRLPIDVTKAYLVLSKYRGSGLAMTLSEDGEILETIEDKNGNKISE
ncbi:Strictosidine synthase, partial [Theobroma cacao]